MAACLLPHAAGAGVASTETKAYCVVGSGDGVGWNWEIRLGPVTVLAGTSAGVSGTSAAVRDQFVSSIETERTAAGQNLPTAMAAAVGGCSAPPNAGFEVEGLTGFDLYVSSPPPPPIPQPSGSLQLVGGVLTSPAFFNPAIYIPMPEPGSLPMLVAGATALAALHRRRARRPRAAASHAGGVHP